MLLAWSDTVVEHNGFSTVMMVMVLVNGLSSSSNSLCWRVEVIHTALMSWHHDSLEVQAEEDRPREREEMFLGQVVGRGGWKGGWRGGKERGEV